MAENMGAGGSLLDLDNDGDLDVLLVQGGRLGDDQGTASSGDRIFRNELEVTTDHVTLQFSETTALVDISSNGYGMGATSGDYDNDGRPDLYITRFGSNQLLRNRSGGPDQAIDFDDVTAMAGVDEPLWSVSAVFFDYDLDGWLDLYVGNYLDFSLAQHRPCSTPAGAPDYCDPSAYDGVADRLFRNLGAGGDGRVRFADMSQTSGLAGVASKSLGAVSADFDGDGWPDLYVANDGMPNQLWINQKDGTFLDDALLAGCAVNRDGTAEASMGVDAADFDADGDFDVFVSHLSGETHTLYVNDGTGFFTDMSSDSGFGGTSLAATGFGTHWLDVDNDGALDLLAVNGAVRSIEALARAGDPNPYHQKNQLFMARGDGSFTDASELAGTAFEASETSRAALFGDLDNDGDIDVLVTNNNGPVRLLNNNAGQLNNFIGLEIVLRGSGRAALGSRVDLIRPGQPIVSRRVGTDGSYAAGNDPRIIFGLGPSTDPSNEIRVLWPDGTMESWDHVRIGRYTTLRQGTGRRAKPSQPQQAEHSSHTGQ